MIKKEQGTTVLTTFMIVFISMLMVSCKDNEGNPIKPLDDFVNSTSFELFSSTIAKKISINQQSIKKEKALSDKQCQVLSNTVNDVDTKLNELVKGSAKNTIDLKQFENDLKKITEAYYTLSQKVNDSAVIHKEVKHKKENPQRFTAILSGMTRWNDHIVVYVLHEKNHLPIRLNESIDHWRLDSVDYQLKRATFIHNKTQQAIVRALP